MYSDRGQETPTSANTLVEACAPVSLDAFFSSRMRSWLPMLLAGGHLLTASCSKEAEASEVQASPNLAQTDAITSERSLKDKAAIYKLCIADALRRYGASYDIALDVTDNWAFAKYSADSEVFTTVVRDGDARPASFVIHVTEHFLINQPAILFEHSSLHEVAHILNDDLTGYHRNGANIEVAEERRVLDLVGLERYEQFLRAYSDYKHLTPAHYEQILNKVKAVKLVPAPSEIEEADTLAAKYFRRTTDGREHLLVYNGELHDISGISKVNTVLHDSAKLTEVIKAGKPMIFFHNHPEDGTLAMFPSKDDFGAAAFLQFLVLRENPDIKVEFRVMMGEEMTSVSYGFKKSIIDEIKENANEHRRLKFGPGRIDDPAPAQAELAQTRLNFRVSTESFEEYLMHACPVDLARTDPEVCNTHPQFFLWPSEKFFLRYRGSVSP